MLFCFSASFAISAQEQYEADDENEDDFAESVEDIFPASIVINGESVSITSYTGTETTVFIPSVIKDLPVVRIEERAFFGKGLTDVTIPGSVTVIKKEAFMNNLLSSIIIPDGVNYIDEMAFAGNRLSEIFIPDSVAAVGNWTFNLRDDAVIRIGSTVSLNQSFDSDFEEIYKRNNRMAGTYRHIGTKWQFTALSAEEQLAAVKAREERPLPAVSFAWNDRGRYRYSVKRYNEAIADFTEAIKLNPRWTFPLYNRGLARLETGDYKGVIADSTEALRIQKNFSDAYRIRGIAYRLTGDYKAALENLNEAIRLNPRDDAAWLCRGDTYMDLKDPDNAISNYNEVIRLDPLSHSAYNNRGVAYNRKGNREQALTDLDHAMAIDPENETSKRNYEKLSANEKIE